MKACDTVQKNNKILTLYSLRLFFLKLNYFTLFLKTYMDDILVIFMLFLNGYENTCLKNINCLNTLLDQRSSFSETKHLKKWDYAV